MYHLHYNLITRPTILFPDADRLKLVTQEEDERRELVRDNMLAMTAELNDFRTNDQYCDISIRVHETCFKCHRLILCAASDYFRLMFNGNFKESSSSEITLHEIEADTFERILQFIYTGDLTITASNFYGLLQASEFYKLTRIEKLLTHYVQIQTNSNTPIENVFKAFSLALQSGGNELVDTLTEYVHRHLDYFSRSSEFFETPFDELSAILEKIKTRLTTFPYHDSFADAILRWIERYVNHSVNPVRQQSALLVQKIDFTKISLEYTEYMAHQRVQDLLAGTGAVATDLADVSAPLNLHVFLNSKTDSTPITSIFTSYKKVLEPNVWRNSYSTKYLCDFLRTTVLDNHLYRLTYLKTTGTAEVANGKGKKLKTMNGHEQKFSLNSTISLFSNTHLEPPPQIVEKYDLCGMGNNIYLYDKCYSDSRTGTDLDADSSYRNIYCYARDVDQWISIPQPDRKCADACMACDEQLVYVIGGKGSRGQAQAYDRRCSKWMNIASSTCTFENAACCAHGGKIYVSGGTVETESVEAYDTIACKWMRMAHMTTPRWNHCMISYWPYLLTVGEEICSHRDDVEMFFEDKWRSMLPPLHQALIDSNITHRAPHRVLDAVLYKPYGF